MRSEDDVDGKYFLRGPEGQFAWLHHVHGGGNGHKFGHVPESNVHRTVEHGAHQTYASCRNTAGEGQKAWTTMARG